MSQNNACFNTGNNRVEATKSYSLDRPSICENNDISSNPTQVKKSQERLINIDEIQEINNSATSSKSQNCDNKQENPRLVYPTIYPTEWLSNLHINNFLSLDKDKVEYKGLCNPLYDCIKEVLKTKKKDYIFIVNTTEENNGEHWVVITNEDLEYSNWKIYDSSVNFGFENYKNLFSQILPEKDEITLTKVNVARQENDHDCGLYSLANAFALAKNLNPVNNEWMKDQMRNHYNNCIKIGEASQFPSSPRYLSNENEFTEEKIYLKSNDDSMSLTCNNCMNQICVIPYKLYGMVTNSVLKAKNKC